MKFNRVKLIFIWLGILYVVTSCVPTKKVIYLQNNNKYEYNETYKTSSYEFRLKEGDVISINVFSLTPGEFNFFSNNSESGQTSNNTFSIDKKGFITLPVAGKISLASLSIEEAQEEIRKKLIDILQDPIVTVNLLSFYYTILGEVRAPGKYNSENPKLNILEAIATASDLTEFADRSRIKLIRTDSDGNTTIRYFSTLTRELLTDDLYYLKPNDIIIVDPLKAKTIRNNQLFAVSTVFGLIGGLGFILISLLR